MRTSRWRALAAAALGLAASAAHGYPLDGFSDTGIRRVEGSRLANAGELRDVRQPPGALLPTEAVDLRLTGGRKVELPAPDPILSGKIAALLGEQANRYGIALLDLTDPEAPRYAEHRGDYRQNVGSVGKLVVAIAFFQALADAWPASIEKRAQLLRRTMVIADGFAHWDHHTVRRFDPESGTLVRRPVQDGDDGSLFEWLDWMLSVSSNSAAAMVMREAMLLRRFGTRYPLGDEEAGDFFRSTSQAELTGLFRETFVEPLQRNGLDTSMLRQGSFFTAEGKRRVRGVGSSYGTARELARVMLLLEQGLLVDEWSSRQIKRLLYMTERRIRYASSPALSHAAVYFKSGSLYSCESEEGFHCGPYRGNKRNFMNSVVIIESPAGPYQLHYVVTVISNVLRVNSAGIHQQLGTEIHRLVSEMHATGE